MEGKRRMKRRGERRGKKRGRRRGKMKGNRRGKSMGKRTIKMRVRNRESIQKGKENQEPVLFCYHYNKMHNAGDIVSIMQEYNVGQHIVRTVLLCKIRHSHARENVGQWKLTKNIEHNF